MTREEIFNMLYNRFAAMIILINADDTETQPGTKLPSHLEGQQQLVLEPGNDANHRDLVVDERGFSAVMSFNRSPFHVFVPWRVVKAFSCPAFTIHWNTEEEAAEEDAEDTEGVGMDTDETGERPKLRLV